MLVAIKANSYQRKSMVARVVGDRASKRWVELLIDQLIASRYTVATKDLLCSHLARCLVFLG